MHKRAATSHTSACHRQHTECLLARMRRDTSLDAGEKSQRITETIAAANSRLIALRHGRSSSRRSVASVRDL
jgi:hypothetical protein